jgi:predicted transcriptional regulator
MDERMNHTYYPPSYETIREWVLTQESVTHTRLQTRFNLTYGRARLVIERLMGEDVIEWESNQRGEYRVMKQTDNNQKALTA